MDTVKIDKKTVKIIAHRGLSGLERENTNAAFVAAGNRSYFGIETDIHATKDGKFIIHHDDSTLRLTGVDLVVEETNYDVLKKLYLTEGMDIKRRDLVMPDLEDYISICKSYDKVAVLEIKNAMNQTQLEQLVKIIDNMEYLENTIFISFYLENVAGLREILPNQKIQLLCSKWKDSLISDLKTYGVDLDIYHKAISPQIVSKLHENGIEINCWTVDNPKRAEELVSYGVDYITSNILE